MNDNIPYTKISSLDLDDFNQPTESLTLKEQAVNLDDDLEARGENEQFIGISDYDETHYKKSTMCSKLRICCFLAFFILLLFVGFMILKRYNTFGTRYQVALRLVCFFYILLIVLFANYITYYLHGYKFVTIDLVTYSLLCIHNFSRQLPKSACY
jgi:hypothetical protein